LRGPRLRKFFAKVAKERGEAAQQLDSPHVPIEFMREGVSPVAQHQFLSPKRSPMAFVSSCQVAYEFKKQKE